jgi:hypothetical protein
VWWFIDFDDSTVGDHDTNLRIIDGNDHTMAHIDMLDDIVQAYKFLVTGVCRNTTHIVVPWSEGISVLGGE